jgi:hypothetical protein
MDEDILNKFLFPYLSQEIIDILGNKSTSEEYIIVNAVNNNNLFDINASNKNSTILLSPGTSIKSTNEEMLVSSAINNLCEIKATNVDDHVNSKYEKIDESQTILTIFFYEKIHFGITITIFTKKEKEKIIEVLKQGFNKDQFILFLKNEVNFSYRLFISVNNDQANRSLIKPDGLCVLRCFYIVQAHENIPRFTLASQYTNNDVDMKNEEKRILFYDFLNSCQIFIGNLNKQPAENEWQQNAIEEGLKKFDNANKILITKQYDHKFWKNKKPYLVLKGDDQLDPDLCRNLVNQDVNNRIFWWTDNSQFYKESEKKEWCDNTSSAYFKKDHLTGDKLWVTSMDCTKDDVRASGCFDLNFDQLQNRIFNKYAHHFVLSGEHAFPALIPFVNEDFFFENFFGELLVKLA